MNDSRTDRLGKALLATPSFYCLATFLPAWLGYLSGYIPWDPSSWLVQGTFGAFVITLVAATAMQTSYYFRNPVRLPEFAIPLPVVIGLCAIGFAGCALYLRDMALKLGGAGTLLVLYGDDPLTIREAQQEFSSIGTQLSYFGWTGAALASIRLGQRRGGTLEIALIVLQLVMNAVFVDRTRPIWIAFTCLMAFLITRRSLSIRGLLGAFFAVAAVGTAFFVLFSLFTGKVVEERNSPIASAAFTFLYYATNAFPYLAHLIDEGMGHTYVPSSVLSPLFQVLSGLGVVETPPPRILPFYNVPFTTNVGTGLEPFYSDGGFVYLAVGAIVYSFGLNALGAWLLARGGALGVIGWAHTCFTAFICFFTPKINNPPYWMMVALGVLGVVLGMRALQLRAVRA
jgi:hypothetical protein